jgi:3-dehydroquinate synthase
MRRVTVAVDPPYDVLIGRGTLDAVGATLPERGRVAVVSQRDVAARYGGAVHDALTGGGRDVEGFTIADGEDAKCLATVETLSRAFATWGLRRGDGVVALGGGVVGDTVGFTAAVYQRGVALVQVPTSLLAMVDAAIGGKTAVNLPEGKNLVGAFHQPVAVVADVDTLASLPDDQYRSGLGEVAKYALLPDGAAVAALLADRTDAVLTRDADTLTDLVAECAAIKAAVVAADPEERTGGRAQLNYGHTLAHAIETTGRYAVPHGEAVAIGLVFAVTLAQALERVDEGTVDATRQLLDRLGLPVTVPDDRRGDDLLVVMRRDKKSRGSLTFVLPGPHGLELVDDPPAALVERALTAVGVRG